MKRGFFKKEFNTLKIDRNALVDFYAYEFCRPIAEQIVSALAAYGRDSRRERIRMAMRFVQDIPYAQPDLESQDWYYGGYIPPPFVVLTMRGDCDSKAVLFVCILVHLIDAEDIIFLNPPGHLLTAVAESSGSGWKMDHRGKYFYLAETAGPRRCSLGEIGLYYSSGYKIEDLHVTDPRLRQPIPIRSAPAIASNYSREYSSSHSSSYSTASGSGVSDRSSSRSTQRGQQQSSTRHQSDDYDWDRHGAESPFSRDVTWFFKFGGGISYYQGDISGGWSDFDDSYPAYIASASLGIPLSSYHYLILGATAGLPSGETVAHQQLMQTGHQLSEVDADKSLFWEAEAGLLLFRFLRVSVGYGKQEISIPASAYGPSVLLTKEYYCASGGIVLRLDRFSIDAGVTVLDGRDYSRLGARAQAGLSFYLW
ncbi:MAG: hypothetical protein JXA28_00470 [Bacteroidetes bacterium]|nr:hypothetical protein [Bacteroidota bacterium]